MCDCVITFIMASQKLINEYTYYTGSINIDMNYIILFFPFYLIRVFSQSFLAFVILFTMVLIIRIYLLEPRGMRGRISYVIVGLTLSILILCTVGGASIVSMIFGVGPEILLLRSFYLFDNRQTDVLGVDKGGEGKGLVGLSRSPKILVGLCLMILVGAISSAIWSVNNVAHLYFEWAYHVKHMTWPVICSQTGNIHFLPAPPTSLARKLANDVSECRKLAEAGDAVAQTELGTLSSPYHESPEKRYEWLKHAAAQDYPPAIGALACAYTTLHTCGQAFPNISKDPEKAAELTLRAASLGDPVSAVVATVLYREGNGVAQDVVNALMWEELLYSWDRLKRSMGHRLDFKNSYNNMISKYDMRPEQVSEAHERALRFMAEHQ